MILLCGVSQVAKEPEGCTWEREPGSNCSPREGADQSGN